MSKVVLSDQERKDFFKRFIDVIHYSDEKSLLPDFFIDFLSQTELDSFIKRLEVFKRLYSGHSYARVNQELSVSPITASKVSRSLRDSSDKFKSILEALSDNLPQPKIEEKEERDDKRSSYL